jgi:hypothetical protein
VLSLFAKLRLPRGEEQSSPLLPPTIVSLRRSAFIILDRPVFVLH